MDNTYNYSKKGYHVLTIMIIAISILFSGCTKTKSDINNYLNTGTNLDEESVYVMPNLSELTDYKSMNYIHTHSDMIIFDTIH